MKKYTLIYICMFILVLTLGGVLTAPLNAATVTANVEINPDRVDLTAYPEKFQFKLWFSGKYKNYNVTDIKRNTILIEGILNPQGPWKVTDGTLTFRVNGKDLIDFVIWPKIYHMGRLDPNPDRGTWFPYSISITVTGLFKDGTEFIGTDTIHAYAPRTNPPPPSIPP